MALITGSAAGGEAVVEDVQDAVAPPRVARRPLLGSRRRQVVAGAVIAGAIAFLLVQGLDNATEYYQTVPQAVSHRAQLGSRQFRIMGTVGPVISHTADGITFTITYDRVSTGVVDTSQPSQLFRPGVPVVLEGHWSGDVFRSDLIMVKHTSNYTPPTDPAVPPATSAPGAPLSSSGR